MPKYLLVIGGGILQARTFEETRNLGLRTILFDSNEKCYCRNLCDIFAPISTTDIPSAVRYVHGLAKEGIGLAGVYTQGCDVEFTVASIAQEFGLPGITVDAAYSCNNKIESRKAFDKAGIAQPKFFYVNEDMVSDAIQLAEIIGFPCVVKSVDNSASRGVTIVNTPKEVIPAFHEALKHSRAKYVIIEEFIPGEEYSVDTIVWDWKVYPCGISDREFIKKDKVAIQNGSLTPSLLPEEIQAEMYDVMQRAAMALGIKQGAFKGDLILHDGKVKVLEVTARLSGGFDSQYRKPYSFGVNLIKATIDIAIGRDLDFKDIVPRWVKFSKTFTIFPNPGVVTEIEGLDETRRIQGCREIFLTVKPGDIIKEYKHCADRVVHIIASADTYHELNEIQKRITQTLRIVTHEA